MVARVNSGKSIKGVLYYNETKVKEGVAQCIDAVGFGASAGELSFANKLQRFSSLTALNKITKNRLLFITKQLYLVRKALLPYIIHTLEMAHVKHEVQAFPRVPL